MSNSRALRSSGYAIFLMGEFNMMANQQMAATRLVAPAGHDDVVRILGETDATKTIEILALKPFGQLAMAVSLPRAVIRLAGLLRQSSMS
jgi:hypothetical protein